MTSTETEKIQETKIPIPADRDDLKHNSQPIRLTNGNTAVCTDEKRSLSVISFHNINYSVKVSQGCCRCKNKIEKNILSNVSGLCQNGMNAILGMTGSGKTSLLDILAGRRKGVDVQGEVMLNGSPLPENFKNISGYVIQEDVVMGMLTVRENLRFSAALRLPSSMSRDERESRVTSVIDELGLSACADTRVGTTFMRGVSGGERKRTCIAMELLTRPAILFLDEPTSGLDANTAQSVMQTLHRLSRSGCTVVFSIHQPRYAIYKLFDYITLLCSGSLVYHGKPDGALNFFQEQGYICELHNNPSDFILDILSGGLSPEPNSDYTLNNSIKVKKSDVESESLLISVDENAEQKIKTSLTDHYKTSNWFTSVENELLSIKKNQSDADIITKSKKLYSTSFLTQLSIVCNRTFWNMIRNPHLLMTQMISAVVLGVLLGLIYYQVDSSYSAGIQNRVGAFFFIVMNYVFGNMASVDLFIKERAIFIHENVSGFYRVSTYFFSKLFCDVLPNRFLPIIVFGSLAYWMIGLKSAAANFFFFLLNVLLTSISGTSVALIFSATMDNHGTGTMCTALVWVLMMIFSGLLVNISTIPYVLQWIQYLSIFRYSMNAFTINELKDELMCDVTTIGNNTVSKCDSGNDYMRRQSIPHETAWDLWSNELALACISIIFLFISYIKLRQLANRH